VVFCPTADIRWLPTADLRHQERAIKDEPRAGSEFDELTATI
jgi:hypothetical protein